MKKWKQLMAKCSLSTLASIALVLSTVAINRMCPWYAYQDEMPKELSKLRKF